MRREPWELLKQAYDKLEEAESCPGVDGIAEVRELIRRTLESDEPTAGEVMRILGHELKAPVSAMVTLLASVEDGYLEHDPERARDMVSRAKSRAEELLPLIDDIMDLGNLSSGEEIPENCVDLSEVTSGVLHLLEPMVSEGGVELTADLPEEDVPVGGAETFLRRVVNNLVMNAYKYNRTRGIVNVSLDSDEAQATLVVEDTGVGISEDDMPHIFSFLYRGRQARRNPGGGMGLGLSMVKQIVELHGGEITAESTEGRGTRMTVRLPVCEQNTGSGGEGAP